MDKSLIQPLKRAATSSNRSKTLILNALHKSSLRRSRSRRTCRKPTRIADADDKDAVERKIRALQSIVPGGESLGVDKLFEQTAEYIMNLQHQVKAMRALSSFFESLETEKCNRGG